MSTFEEVPLASELIFAGKLLQIHRDRVRLPDGSSGLREYVCHPGAVVIIPVLSDRRLLFERQYRYPLRREFLELPAGKLDPGEDILDAAVRELREETGYRAERWRHLGVMHPCIGYSDERIEIFLAQDLVELGAPQLDQGEFLSCEPLSLVAARDAVLSGAITDAKTITALYWAETMLDQPD